ncbi:MAG TPA: hypothetical protein VFP68_04235 [Burkholderiaceae bacterium]|nr:hypothetical protein [Burkholderiaceae bacterium]
MPLFSSTAASTLSEGVPMFFVGNGDTGELRLTEFARRELEAPDQRKRVKRSRHHFVHHPTTSLLQHVDVESKQLRIEEGKSDQPLRAGDPAAERVTFLSALALGTRLAGQ